jgi:hypothetical protein
MMRKIARILALVAALGMAACESNSLPPPKEYAKERPLEIPALRTEVWAVAPVINLSGQSAVDPLLQADVLYQQLQQVHGMTVVPVDRVIQTYAGLNIERVESPQQAAVVCDVLGVDALLVATVTQYDPYTPPKMAASLVLFRKPRDFHRPVNDPQQGMGHLGAIKSGQIKQSVGMFDSADGTTRQALMSFAVGRSDPNGPMAEREYLLSMDSYSGFVYHQLIADLLGVPAEP